MKAVMLSIQPKWCELIASSKKTIEVRKTAPKCDTPFKCYIYETKGTFDITLCLDLNMQSVKVAGKGRGKVIGEFVCDKVDKFVVGSLACDDVEEKACLSYKEICDYFYGDNYDNTIRIGYAWHISDLKVYDKPKELGEFYSLSYQKNCKPCDALCEYYPDCVLKKTRKPLTRPFQSWGYCEEPNE